MRRSRVLLVAASALMLAGTSPGSVSGAEATPDVCLSVRLGDLPDRAAWPEIIGAVDAATASEARPQLFPARELEVLLGADDAPAIIAIWREARTSEQDPVLDGCVADGATWTARIGRSFLVAGADNELAAAPTTPGIESNVEVEWYPDEGRVRTWLEFEGPLGIPNGTCWIDDVLTTERGVAVASGDTDLRTSPFAEGACGRFFDYLARGGAGEQAVTLLPSVVPLADGGTLAFLVSSVTVEEDAILMSGTVETR